MENTVPIRSIRCFSTGIFRLCFCTDRECVQLSVRERNSTHVCNEHVSTELFSLCSTEGKNVSSSFSFSIISSLKFIDYLLYLSFYFDYKNIVPGEFVCLTDLFNSRLNSLNFCPTKFRERRGSNYPAWTLVLIIVHSW